MEPLSRTWLAFARFYMAMVSFPRSWQDLSKASKELAMDLGKDTMASDTGIPEKWIIARLKGLIMSLNFGL